MSERYREIRTSRGILRGMVHLPETGWSGMAVILHGYFSSHKCGPAWLYVQIARLLCKLGLCVFRFDYWGVGDSDGEFHLVTLEGEVQDAMSICRFVRRHSRGKPLTAIAHSMGCNVLLLAQSSLPCVDRMVLIAPDVEMRGGVDRLFDRSQLRQLKTQGWTIRKGLPIGASFVEELRQKNILEVARSIQTPCNILQGDADELYSMSGASRLARALPCGSFVKIPHADHNFMDPGSRRTLLRSLRRICGPASLDRHRSQPARSRVSDSVK